MKYINKMPEFRNAIQTAKNTDHPKPPWLATDTSTVQHFSAAGISQQAIDVYMLSQKPNGRMGGIGWWQAANGYTAMALRDLWAAGSRNYSTLSRILRQCEGINKDFVNDFNDDSLWWALCCVHMYDIEGDRWYIEKAKAIWRHVRKSVCGPGQVFFNGNDMEGAVFWTTRKDEEQINAISTGLFAELSVRLALLCGHESTQKREDSSTEEALNDADPSVEEYLEATRCSLAWILRCRYRPREGVVLDHIKLKKEKKVDWTFTYNTGVALGTCALLYQATGEEEYMLLACHMAQKSIGRKGWVEDDGVLTERRAYGRGTHDPRKNNDAVGFKAVLIRQLCALHEVIEKTVCSLPQALEVLGMIKTFISINFQSQLKNNTNGRAQYGPWWNGPYEVPTSHSQMAVLDVMAAAVLVNRRVGDGK